MHFRRFSVLDVCRTFYNNCGNSRLTDGGFKRHLPLVEDQYMGWKSLRHKLTISNFIVYTKTKIIHYLNFINLGL